MAFELPELLVAPTSSSRRSGTSLTSQKAISEVTFKGSGTSGRFLFDVPNRPSGRSGTSLISQNYLSPRRVALGAQMPFPGVASFSCMPMIFCIRITCHCPLQTSASSSRTSLASASANLLTVESYDSWKTYSFNKGTHTQHVLLTTHA